MMASDQHFRAQYSALTESVGVAELPGRTILAVTGADRTQILQSFSTNDVKKLSVGSGCEAFITSSQGKTLGHVLIFCQRDQHLIDTSPGQAATLIAHFDRYVITEDVQFVDQTADYCDLLVAGPKAASLLTEICGTNPPERLLAHTPANIAGHNTILRRVEYAGPIAYFIQVAAGDAPTVLTALQQAGAFHCEPAAVESARLESGVPLFGHDITPDNLPQEVARDEQAISFTKGCYLGQETVARIDALGHVNRLRVGLKIDSDMLPVRGTILQAGQQPVGHSTSAAWSPRLNSPLAMGYVRRTYASKGTKLLWASGMAEVIQFPLASAERSSPENSP
jgi:tRNA-modifying protein YgfZ